MNRQAQGAQALVEVGESGSGQEPALALASLVALEPELAPESGKVMVVGKAWDWFLRH